MKKLIVASAFVAAAGVASAQDAVTYSYEGSYDDASFAVENAIIGEGLVIDYISHVGEMLNRTGIDVGSDVTIFDDAQVFLFCSAVTSREVMEADPMNIRHCPYGIFVEERDGAVQIGYRTYPEGEMQVVQSLLDGIVQSALDM